MSRRVRLNCTQNSYSPAIYFIFASVSALLSVFLSYCLRGPIIHVLLLANETHCELVNVGAVMMSLWIINFLILFLMSFNSKIPQHGSPFKKVTPFIYLLAIFTSSAVNQRIHWAKYSVDLTLMFLEVMAYWGYEDICQDYSVMSGSVVIIITISESMPNACRTPLGVGWP